MTSRFKFVALTLVLVLVAGTLSLLFAERGPLAAAAGTHCPPGCRMAVMHDSPMAGRMASRDERRSNQDRLPPCCRIRSDHSAPAAVSQAITRMLVSRTSRVNAPAMPFPIEVESQAELVRITTPISPQAALCTFLI